MAFKSLSDVSRRDLLQNNGFSLAKARAETAYGASFLEWFAGEAERTYGQVVPAANTGQRILTIKQPLGVAALLAPWNFPIAMIARKAGTALSPGCTTVCNPVGERPLSCIAQGVLAQDAGFSHGSIKFILNANRVSGAGETFCNSQKVQMISFSMSTRVGKLLTEQCGQTLKKLSLELGSTNPLIVSEDADLDRAVETLMVAKIRNSGQTCVTANQVFVQKGIYDEFSLKVSERMQQLKVGLGFQAGVNVGPLTHQGELQKALSYIKGLYHFTSERIVKYQSFNRCKTSRAVVILGGSLLPELGGNFIQPTLMTNMKQEMITTRKEVFAPVLGLYQFEDESEAITLANSSNVGVGSFVITESISRSWRIAEALDTGMVSINVGSLSACESPFGGIKESGYGREGGGIWR
ncbi:Glutarate-semialdehyde dehydrogenase DavD [Colletotrichum fructicola]|uniref:Succinate semialdehyde dehydrogenase n=1 Tax=Colletotrichum fructicola (strain Nara gc5) TaxID=1213859 RepID=L2FFR9_COLFN|nr:Glutarate-semialdehyde dehydrogenase DavD [Colletotrichum fructicola]KAF4886173.1 Glutarate-semialdehyde dehydrogenase DavD [Colletotrichum fructicola]KAF4922885.1 Glutarate-semialdehyde dehydrogenase DavD [Colletotrichum fructicola]